MGNDVNWANGVTLFTRICSLFRLRHRNFHPNRNLTCLSVSVLTELRKRSPPFITMSLPSLASSACRYFSFHDHSFVLIVS